jgi:predicted dehydrogenase
VSAPLRVAVVGVGHLGRHHARVLASLPEATLVGVVDANADRAAEVAAANQTRVIRACPN